MLTRKRSQVQTLSRPPLFSLSARCQRLADSAPRLPRPRCGRSLLPVEPDAPSSAGRHGTNPSATTTERGHHLPVQPHGRASAGNLPCTPCGDLGAPAPSRAPPPTDRHLARDQLPWSARRRARRRSRYACQAAAQVWRRPSCEPRTANVRPSFLARPDSGSGDDHAARGPHGDTSNPVRQPWPVRRTDVFRIQRGADSATAAAADTGRACLSGHPDHTGRVDIGRLDTGRPPDQLDGRPSAWRTADADRATNGVTSVRTSLDGHDGDRRLGGPTSLGLPRVRRSATHDGSAVTTPAAAVTGQLRSTARHEVAPRRTAVRRRIGSSVLRKVMRQRRARQVRVRRVLGLSKDCGLPADLRGGFVQP